MKNDTKNYCSKILIVFLLHLLICVILSLDLPFLEGSYMGFSFTFLIIWGLSLPIVTAATAITTAIIKIIQRKLSVSDIVCTATGILILLTYFASALGLFRNIALNSVYILIIIETLVIFGCWEWNTIKRIMQKF